MTMSKKRRQRRIPVLYMKIIEQINSREISISEFKSILPRIRIPKKKSSEVLIDMIDMGLVEKKGRKIRFL